MDKMNSQWIFIYKWLCLWILHNLDPVGIQNKSISIFSETSKHQTNESRIWVLDQWEAMAGQGGGAGWREYLCDQ